MNEEGKGDTETWLNHLKEEQAKDEKNREQQGKGHPERRLNNKQHRNR